MALFDDDDRGSDLGDEVEKPAKKSASTLLVELADKHYIFGVSDGGETFAVPRDGPKVVLLLRGGRQSLRAQLARAYFLNTGKAAPQQALADALLVIEGAAQESDEEQLHLRVARHEGALWLDLGDTTGRAVKITDTGWTIAPQSPVLFKRTALNSPLPAPTGGGNLDELWQWLNVREDDRPLLLAALVASLHPEIPHPVIGITGEQGTGKTTALKALTMLLDPSPVPARKPPRDADSWVTAAGASWFVGLDNISDIPPWLSDSICRAVTGDGDVRRRLYSDNDLTVFAFRRCLVLSGIDFGALRGDLADRMLLINLHTIADENRIDEQDIWPRWDVLHPRVLGALLDLAAGVEAELPYLHLESKPRMADFARILAAVDQVMGTTGFATYIARQGAMAVDSLEGDDFIVMAKTMISATFEGTSAELLNLVTPSDDGWRSPKSWPSNARSVTTKLHRQAPVMRKAGWTVLNDDGANHDKVTRWTLTPPVRRPREACNPDPRDPLTRETSPFAGHAGHAGQKYGPSHDDEADLVDEDLFGDYLDTEATG